jgi:uncharacterized membrane protein YfcA
VAALLLAGNNLAKVVAYRRTIPLRAVAVVLVCTVAGTVTGAKLLLAAPEDWVRGAVVAAFAVTFLAEWVGVDRPRRISAPLLALCAGATSGFSGTSGPLKGIALRSLGLDRLHLVARHQPCRSPATRLRRRFSPRRGSWIRRRVHSCSWPFR